MNNSNVNFEDQFNNSKRYKKIFDLLKIGLIVCRSNSEIIDINNEILNILEITLDDLKEGSSKKIFIDENEKNLSQKELFDYLMKSHTSSIKNKVYKIQSNSNLKWILISKYLLNITDSSEEILITFVDVTEKGRIASKLKKQNEIFDIIFNTTPMGMCITDEKGNFETVNRAYTKIYGYSKEELIGKHFTVIVPEKNRETLAKLHKDFIEKGTEIRGKWEILAKNNIKKYVLADAVRLNTCCNNYKKVTFVTDITEMENIKKELIIKNNLLDQQVKKDGLTQLYNHITLHKILNEQIDISRENNLNLSIAMFDLDFFKHINDTYGHQKGDEVLKECSKIIKNSIRRSDFAGRYGGEEFLIIMPKTNLLSAFSISNRIRKEILSSITNVNITISGGISQYEVNENANDLIKRADENLYIAKKNGRNKIVGKD